MRLTYIQQSGSPPVGDGGDQYTGLDRFGRVIDQRWIKDSSGADLERVEYGFDRASNRVWRDNPVADALSAKQDEYYTYDGLNQLLTLQRGTLNSGKTGISGTPAWEEDFTIDPTGNWDNYVNQVNGTTTLNQPRTHNAVNEVETISGSSSLMVQNAAGNMSKAPKPLDWSSAFTMTYDAWQRLVKIKSGSTTVATYAYDGQNRRVTKTTGTTLRHYYYSSQWQILEERLNTTTTADRQFVWGLMALDNLILRDRGSERFYSLQDLFSCTAIADTTGTIQERYSYNAFGLSRVMDADFNVISTSSYDWETRYDNYRFDAESNFYQVRYRYLHPMLGRWLTRDPIGYKDGANLYWCAPNNPIKFIDSLGLGCVVTFKCDLLSSSDSGSCDKVCSYICTETSRQTVAGLTPISCDDLPKAPITVTDTEIAYGSFCCHLTGGKLGAKGKCDNQTTTAKDYEDINLPRNCSRAGCISNCDAAYEIVKKLCDKAPSPVAKGLCKSAAAASHELCREGCISWCLNP